MESRDRKGAGQREELSCHTLAVNVSDDPRKSCEAGVVLQNCLKVGHKDRAFLKMFIYF